MDSVEGRKETEKGIKKAGKMHENVDCQPF